MENSQRAQKLLEILYDVKGWNHWLIDHPGRIAKFLGLCEQGVPAIMELAPAIKTLQSKLLEEDTDQNNNPDHFIKPKKKLWAIVNKKKPLLRG